MDVHVRDLRSFVAVAEEGNVTRAAARLFLSQPAVSRQIQALEQQVQTPLFERGAAGVTLTAAGTALLPHAAATVAAWEEGRRAVETTVQRRAGTVVVGLAIGVGRGLIPTATAEWEAQHPGCRVDVRQAGFGDLTVGVASGAADVGFCWLPLPEDAGLAHRVLVEEARQLALPVDHPLAGRAELLLEDVLDEPFLALPESTGSLRSFWLGDDVRGGRPARIGAVVHSPDETIEALGRGLGVAFISSGNADIYRRPEFVVRPVRGLPPSHLAIAWRADERRATVCDFVEACVQAARRWRREGRSAVTGVTGPAPGRRPE